MAASLVSVKLAYLYPVLAVYLVTFCRVESLVLSVSRY
jgi:hypothetical protein